MEYKLILGDCLEFMKSMPDKSVDAVITDLPYGTTACSWDEIIPFAPMWEQVERICKGAFVTTASQPFTSKLVMSNLDWFRHDWIWNKHIPGNFANVKHAPLKYHEDIVVFSEASPLYNPQLRGNVQKPWRIVAGISEHISIGASEKRGVGYPMSIVSFPRPNHLSEDGCLHPTQKPVRLYEYLIRTYTNEGNTVLDFCMGSGTTGVACVQTGRNFIGCEIDPKYFAIAEKRIKQAAQQEPLFVEAAISIPIQECFNVSSETRREQESYR